MKLPTYPLFTIDPMMSMWSKNDILNADNTIHWCGATKKLFGAVEVNGEAYTFLGKCKNKKLQQTAHKISFLTNEYMFENDLFELKICFRSFANLQDLSLLGLPISAMEYKITPKSNCVIDSFDISLSVSQELCYDTQKGGCKKTEIKTENHKQMQVGRIGQATQRPLRYTADGVNTDWGYIYLVGEEVLQSKIGLKKYLVAQNKALKGHILFGYDDIYAIEYFGKKIKGYWTNEITNIEEALFFVQDNYGEIVAKCDDFENKLNADSLCFGKNYNVILKASYRQVIAAHKLVKTADGTILYMSKECHSNGCINTVDVSYPSMPLFLLYQPILVQGMMNGILEFANMSCWKYDFAPHDLGRYPLANGQAYSLQNKDWRRCIKNSKAKIFEQSFAVFDDNRQMPVEECGNMLIMAYAYFGASKDKAFLSKHAPMLKKWADYLISKGIILENQLCTDDFAGHSEKNVNLAIKSVMGIACFAKIASIIGQDGKPYEDKAAQYAKQLTDLAKQDDYLNFAIGKADTWSLKYNLIWDKIFAFRLFDESIFNGEITQYGKVKNEYGVPLDYRNELAKSDWLMWASVLSDDTSIVETYATYLKLYLENCTNKTCFGDYYNTKTAVDRGMNHRSVQGGLWMPVYAKKAKANE